MEYDNDKLRKRTPRLEVLYWVILVLLQPVTCVITIFPSHPLLGLLPLFMSLLVFPAYVLYAKLVGPARAARRDPHPETHPMAGQTPVYHPDDDPFLPGDPAVHFHRICPFPEYVPDTAAAGLHATHRDESGQGSLVDCRQYGPGDRHLLYPQGGR